MRHTELIQVHKLKIKELQDEIAVIREHAKQINRFDTFLRRLAKRYQLRTGEEASVTVWIAWGAVRGSLVLHNCPSLKVGVVPSILRTIENNGLVAKGSTDYAARDGASRTFHMSKPREVADLPMQLGVDVILKEDSQSCRKVLVGVRHEEIPEYKIVCT